MSLSARMKTERGEQTQQQIADKAGISQSTIGVLESGTQQTSGYIPEIAHALGVDAYWLKTGKGSRYGAASSLSPEQQVIIDAWPLIDAAVLATWIDHARKRLAEAESMQSAA
jgi:transcriptional regulator with XRE-family HTH domain